MTPNKTQDVKPGQTIIVDLLVDGGHGPIRSS